MTDAVDYSVIPDPHFAVPFKTLAQRFSCQIRFFEDSVFNGYPDPFLDIMWYFTDVISNQGMV